MLRSAKFAQDVRHRPRINHANIARTCRVRSAQQGMLLLDPSVHQIKHICQVWKVCRVYFLEIWIIPMHKTISFYPGLQNGRLSQVIYFVLKAKLLWRKPQHSLAMMNYLDVS
jgi:hypothetical protein